jgi:hypothetical protein
LLAWFPLSLLLSAAASLPSLPIRVSTPYFGFLLSSSKSVAAIFLLDLISLLAQGKCCNNKQFGGKLRRQNVDLSTRGTIHIIWMKGERLTDTVA